MTSNKENILGIDIGGSKINMVLWNGKKVLKTWQKSPASLLTLKEGIKHFSVSKIGIAIPGLIDKKTKKILKCPNLKSFEGLNLKKIFKANVKVGNDAKCFLLAETKLGFVKKQGNVLGIIFGTGVGGAFAILNIKSKIENIFYGRDGWAGEFGHMVIDKGKSWEKLYQETKQKPKEQEKINAIGLANLINVLNPETIILGGKGAKMPKKELIAKHLLIKEQMPEIINGKLGDNAVAVGAALLFLKDA